MCLKGHSPNHRHGPMEGETNCLKIFRMLYILLRFYFEFHDIMNHDMTGRALRKMVVRRIAAGIFTRRFFKIEPEVLRFNENLGPKRSQNQLFSV